MVDYNLSNADNGDYNPFRHPFYLIANLALRGDLDDAQFPMKYDIDWIRHFAQP